MASDPEGGEPPERLSRSELDRSLVSGIAWTGGMRMVTQTLRWGVALLVVRLLTPTDYGLVGMAMAYLGLADMLNEFGLSAAVIQRRNLTRDQIASISGVSLLMGVVLAVLSVAVSGMVAGFFDEPQVQLIVIVLSATFVFTGADVVSRSLLKRDLEFDRLAWIAAAEAVTFSGVSLVLAVQGYGFWSLVLASLVGQFVRSVLAIWWRPHLIHWPRNLGAIRSELVFGSHVVVSRFALYVRRFSDIVVVGRFLGTEALGAYNVAWQQADIAVERIRPVITAVSPSVLAAAQDDGPAFRRYVRVFTEGIAILAFPAAVGLAIVADDFVLLVFGDRWMSAVAPMRILALAGISRSITPILSQLLVARDQTKKNMEFTIAGAVVIPLLILVGSRWGTTGVALGWLIGHPLVMGFVLVPNALKCAEMGFWEYLGSLRAAALCTSLMAVAVLLVRYATPGDWPLAARFGIEVGVGVAVYAGTILPLYRTRVRTFLTMLRAGRREPGGPDA